jgi:hypothetical protein
MAVVPDVTNVLPIQIRDRSDYLSRDAAGIDPALVRGLFISDPMDLRASRLIARTVGQEDDEFARAVLTVAMAALLQ